MQKCQMSNRFYPCRFELLPGRVLPFCAAERIVNENIRSCTRGLTEFGKYAKLSAIIVNKGLDKRRHGGQQKTASGYVR